MSAVRFRKIAADLLLRWRRTVPTLLGVAFGLFGFGTAMASFTILSTDLDANFRRTDPANIVVGADAGAAASVDRIAALPGVVSVEERPIIALRVEMAPGKWLPLLLTVVTDFTHLPVSAFYPQSGSWPPPEGSLLLERDSLSLFDGTAVTALRIGQPDGSSRDVPLSGTLSDPAQHPSRMEMVLYGYVTRKTFDSWHYDRRQTRLLIATLPEDATQTGARIEALLRDDGVAIQRFDAQPTARYGHQFQLDAILALLTALTVVMLMLCVVLIFDLINTIVTAERRSIGVMRSLGARGSQIATDYLLGIGALGLLAGLIALAPALWCGQALARVILTAQNFNLLSARAAPWLPLALLAGSVVGPLMIAGLRIWPAMAMPVRDALARSDLARGQEAADHIAVLFRKLPPLPRMALWSVAVKPWRALLTAVILSLGLAFFMAALTLRSSMLQTVDAVRASKPYDIAVSLTTPRRRTELAEWLGRFPEIGRAEFWSQSTVNLYADGRRLSNSIALATLPPDAAAIRPDMIGGEWLSSDRPHDVVVNQALLRDEPALRQGGTYQLRSGDDAVEIRIAGVMREFGGARLYAPLTLMGDDGRSNLMLLSLADGSLSAQRRMAARLEGPGIAGVETSRLLEAIIIGHLAPISGLLLVIAGLALLVGATGLASSISVGIVERFREIGVMKAIGGGGKAIFLLFCSEALVIGLIGWAIALAAAPALSHPVVAIFGSAIIRYPFDYRGDPWAGLITLAVAGAVALAASLPPTRAALKASVSRALRSE